MPTAAVQTMFRQLIDTMNYNGKSIDVSENRITAVFKETKDLCNKHNKKAALLTERGY